MHGAVHASFADSGEHVAFDDYVMATHTAELEELQRSIMLQFASGKADHSFSDVLDRLPDRLRSEFLAFGAQG